MFLGDLFDTYEVGVWDFLQVHNMLVDWLSRRTGMLYLVAGNHDLSKTSNVLGSFDLLCSLLGARAPNRVYVIKQPSMTEYGYVIPHLPNQAAFDAALAEVPACAALFLHCNYDNKFAAQSDQSLNISKEQVDTCPAERIIIAHEHQQKASGKVLIPGNQIATSVSDWLGADAKYRTVINTNGVHLQKVADIDSEYTQQPWNSPQITDHKFVRMVGEATAEQAAEVVNAVAKFRAASLALVVTNGVNIGTMDGLGDFSTSLESVRAFDVWRALGEVLESGEIETLKGLE